jgi:hypothetical protein
MQQKDFINNLNIHYVTFNKQKWYLLLSKYLFTRELALTSKVCEMSISDLALMLEKDRVRFNKNKPSLPVGGARSAPTLSEFPPATPPS